ncbi:MAG: hypothetical protein WDW36_000148 [Sanguina aurantia]
MSDVGATVGASKAAVFTVVAIRWRPTRSLVAAARRGAGKLDGDRRAALAGIAAAGLRQFDAAALAARSGSADRHPARGLRMMPARPCARASARARRRRAARSFALGAAHASSGAGTDIANNPSVLQARASNRAPNAVLSTTLARGAMMAGLLCARRAPAIGKASHSAVGRCGARDDAAAARLMTVLPLHGPVGSTRATRPESQFAPVIRGINATGNWIKVVQRVPVRIALDNSELDKHPLRIGLSSDVTIDITDDKGPVLAPQGAEHAPVAETTVYEQMARQAARARSVIQAGDPARPHALHRPVQSARSRSHAALRDDGVDVRHFDAMTPRVARQCCCDRCGCGIPPSRAIQAALRLMRARCAGSDRQTLRRGRRLRPDGGARAPAGALSSWRCMRCALGWLLAMARGALGGGMALALWAMTVVIAPVLGPILGGWLTDNYSWPWIFYINVPVGILAAVSTWYLLHKRESKIVYAPIDAVGLTLLVLGIGCLQFMLDNGNDKDWFSSPLIVVLGLVALVCLVFLGAWPSIFLARCSPSAPPRWAGLHRQLVGPHQRLGRRAGVPVFTAGGQHAGQVRPAGDDHVTSVADLAN